MPAEIPIFVLLTLAAILFFISFVQGAIGFAAGMLGIPLMMLAAGLSMSQAVAIAIVTSGMQNIMGGIQLRKSVVWQDVWRPMLIRLVALPLGVWSQVLVQGQFSESTVKQMVGAILLLVLLVQYAMKIKPREQLHVAWEFIAFLTAGFMVGFCGMGGPPMVLWIMAHTWSNRRTRGFMFVVFFSSLIPQAVLMVLFQPASEEIPILYFLAGGLLAMPVVLLGTFIGVRVGDKISRPMLRVIIYIVLISVAVSAVVWPIINGDGEKPEEKNAAVRLIGS